MKTQRTLTRLALPVAAALGALAVAACGQTAARPAAPPPLPTTCYLRASDANAVLEVTGVNAAAGCREFQQWALKASSSQTLAWLDARPEPSALKLPVFPTAEEKVNGPTIKETCRYTLGAFSYSVTDTGMMNVGTVWCRELYARAVKAG